MYLHRSAGSYGRPLAELATASTPTVEYLNRLSDLLFILSRVANTDSHGGTGETAG